jgi:hypothetical protein
LAAAFKGSAAEAANTDPYQKMQIIFGEIQERIGTALLPVLDDFAAWMSSPPGQAQLKEIADAAKDVLTQLADTAKWAIANKDWLLPVVAGIGAITTAIKAANAAMLIFNATTKLNPLVLAGTAILGVAAYTGELTSPENTAETNAILKSRGSMIPAVGSGPGREAPNLISPRVAERAPVNVTIYTPKVSAQDVVNVINKAQKTGYTGQITMPRS